jgi:hypothetical protein
MNKEALKTVDETLSRFDDEPELIELGPGETSLHFFQRIYRSIRQPMARRMRAAEFALQHEHPRLGAIATASMNGRDFAALLERAIRASNKEREVKQIEAHALDLTSEKSR